MPTIAALDPDTRPRERLAARGAEQLTDGELLAIVLGAGTRGAGALDVAFKRMGDMVLEDMALLDQGLPPLKGKRAERETVSRMRSKPVTRN